MLLRKFIFYILLWFSIGYGYNDENVLYGLCDITLINGERITAVIKMAEGRNWGWSNDTNGFIFFNEDEPWCAYSFNREFVEFDLIHRIPYGTNHRKLASLNTSRYSMHYYVETSLKHQWPYRTKIMTKIVSDSTKIRVIQEHSSTYEYDILDYIPLEVVVEQSHGVNYPDSGIVHIPLDNISGFRLYEAIPDSLNEQFIKQSEKIYRPYKNLYDTTYFEHWFHNLNSKYEFRSLDPLHGESD